MASMLEIFAELGRRLAFFGEDSRSRQVIPQALAANEWFSEDDVLMAVDAIRREYLSCDKLEHWLKRYPISALQPRRVAIVMAGNIPLVGFFDLMCVLMCGHKAYVKPSHKDSVLINYIIDLLKSISPNIPVYDYSPSQKVDMAIATGGDSAAAHYRSAYADLPVLIRGSRHSVAVLDGNESEAEIEGLHRDIFSYSGLGCRNVSLLLLPRGYCLQLQQPANLGPMYRGSYFSQRALMTMLGQPFEDYGFCLARQQFAFSDTVSCINYAFYDDLAQVNQWLCDNDSALQCVVTHCATHPRAVPFGQAQYPTLSDYADGVDVMEFLIR